MDRSEILNRVRRVVEEKLGLTPEEIETSDDLLDLGADSLDEVEVLMAIEEEFSITISEPEREAITTIGDIIDLVEKKMG